MSSAVLEAAKTCDKSMPGDSTLDAMCNAFLSNNIENILNVKYINGGAHVVPKLIHMLAHTHTSKQFIV